MSSVALISSFEQHVSLFRSVQDDESKSSIIDHRIKLLTSELQEFYIGRTSSLAPRTPYVSYTVSVSLKKPNLRTDSDAESHGWTKVNSRASVSPFLNEVSSSSELDSSSPSDTQNDESRDKLDEEFTDELEDEERDAAPYNKAMSVVKYENRKYIIRGLDNSSGDRRSVGNLCFLNSAFQLLFNLPRIILNKDYRYWRAAETLFSRVHAVLDNKELAAIDKGLPRGLNRISFTAILDVLSSAESSLFDSEQEVLSLRLYPLLVKYAGRLNDYAMGQQSTPDEVLIFICDISEYIDKIRNTVIQKSETSSDYSSLKEEAEKDDYACHVMFRGILTSNMIVNRCKRTSSEKHEPFSIPTVSYQLHRARPGVLSMSERIALLNSRSISKLVSKEYTRKTTYVHDKRECENSQPFEKEHYSEKQLFISRVPPVGELLTVHVKRKIATRDARKRIRYEKVEGNIYLDEKVFIDVCGNQVYNDATNSSDISLVDATEWSPVGYIEHRGDYDSGHYISYFKVDEDVWACADDAKITYVSKESALKNRQATLIVLVRVK